jgi:undecaprenyl-diphosphatase
MAANLFAGMATAALATVQRSTTRRFDLRGIRAIEGRGPRRLRRLASRAAEPNAVLLEAAALATIASRRSPRVAMCIIGAPLLALGVSKALKHAVGRPRPPWHLLRKGLQSFPSSHTAGTGALLWVIARAVPAPRAVRVIASVAVAADLLLVGATRIAEGAHWPSDVIAGAVIGIAAGATACALAHAPERVPRAAS